MKWNTHRTYLVSYIIYSWKLSIEMLYNFTVNLLYPTFFFGGRFSFFGHKSDSPQPCGVFGLLVVTLVWCRIPLAMIRRCFLNYTNIYDIVSYVKSAVCFLFVANVCVCDCECVYRSLWQTIGWKIEYMTATTM